MMVFKGENVQAGGGFDFYFYGPLSSHLAPWWAASQSSTLALLFLYLFLLEFRLPSHLIHSYLVKKNPEDWTPNFNTGCYLWPDDNKNTPERASMERQCWGNVEFALSETLEVCVRTPSPQSAGGVLKESANANCLTRSCSSLT